MTNIFKYGGLVACFLIAVSQQADASCTAVGFGFTLGTDTGTSQTTDGAPCRNPFSVGVGRTLTSLSVARRPTNGQLSVSGMAATYTPRKGFKGTDSYALKLCGTTVDNAQRCSVFTYSTTVQ
jgi:hypothetical protein